MLIKGGYKMIDYSNAQIVKVVIHVVGNKSKDEQLILADQVAIIDDDATKQYVKEYFFSSFNFEVRYHFTHETDVNLNELYAYCTKLFHKPESLVEESASIAKHLYSVSTHPNIKKGELYIALIQNCIIDGKPTNAIGIFKSENKNFYLNINSINKHFSISSNSGINPKRLDKGCLIFDCGSKQPELVYIVDTNHNDTMYWKDDFLKVVETETSYKSTSSFMNLCKRYVFQLPDTDKSSKISIINNSVHYFETHDTFIPEEFAEESGMNTKHLQSFQTFLSDNKYPSGLKAQFEISKRAVSTAKRTIKSMIKLDSDIEIKIPTKIGSVDEIIENGYDPQKELHYYKIYYKTEK